MSWLSSARTQSFGFITVVLAVAWAAAPVGDGLLLATSPLLVTIVMLIVGRERMDLQGRERLGLGRFGWPTWPAAVVTTAGVTVTAYLLAVVAGLAELRPAASQVWVDLAILVVTGTVLAFCEEIGWRGYLQPRVATWAGRRGAYFVVGVVWLSWHLAYITRTDGYHADGNRVVVLTLFSLTVIASSVLFGELRDRSGSVWPAVVAHLAHNVAFAWLGTSVLRTDHPVAVEEYLAGDTGLLVLLGTIAAIALLAGSSRHHAAPQLTRTN